MFSWDRSISTVYSGRRQLANQGETPTVWNPCKISWGTFKGTPSWLSNGVIGAMYCFRKQVGGAADYSYKCKKHTRICNSMISRERPGIAQHISSSCKCHFSTRSVHVSLMSSVINTRCSWTWTLYSSSARCATHLFSFSEVWKLLQNFQQEPFNVCLLKGCKEQHQLINENPTTSMQTWGDSFGMS